ncbi:MAG: hypothetical protein FRX49_01496 [Trebouxia sp. A1-2]|nr:MAG: hypothetical protein FRX49_01496 [Trebouxia sp. A1-2]
MAATTSGMLAVLSSQLREKTLTLLSDNRWIWARVPSYLYSARKGAPLSCLMASGMPSLIFANIGFNGTPAVGHPQPQPHKTTGYPGNADCTKEHWGNPRGQDALDIKTSLWFHTKRGREGQRDHKHVEKDKRVDTIRPRDAEKAELWARALAAQIQTVLVGTASRQSSDELQDHSPGHGTYDGPPVGSHTQTEARGPNTPGDRAKMDRNMLAMASPMRSRFVALLLRWFASLNLAGLLPAKEGSNAALGSIGRLSLLAWPIPSAFRGCSHTTLPAFGLGLTGLWLTSLFLYAIEDTSISALLYAFC